MSWQRGWGGAEIGSDARPVSRGRMVTMSQGELADMVKTADSKANRAFAYAAVIFLILGFGASEALHRFGWLS